MPYFGRILQFFKGGREWLVLLFSLFLAFFMWSVRILSQNYSVYLKYNVEVYSNLPGRSAEPNSVESVIVNVNANGFYILRQRISKSAKDALLAIDGKQFKKIESESDGFYLLGRDIKEKISNAIGSDARVDDIASDTLKFYFPKRENKRVPLYIKSFISFKDQFMATGKLVLKPDSITIYGEENLLENIDSLLVNHIEYDDVSKEISGIVNVKPIKGIRFSDENVYYTLKVDRYVEKKITIPVNTINVPAGKSFIIIPSSIDITYRQSLSSSDKFEESDFSAIVDYNDYIYSMSSLIRPVFKKKPSNTLHISIDPSFVEVILKDE